MKKSRIVKFSISIRKDTQALIDQKANEENRSRSAMIDMICSEALKKGKQDIKQAFWFCIREAPSLTGELLMEPVVLQIKPKVPWTMQYIGQMVFYYCDRILIKKIVATS